MAADGYVRPGRGIGSAILELTGRRARERGAARLHNATLHGDERGRSLFEENGYRYVRSFLRMAVELEHEPPEPARLEGLRLERYDARDARAFRAATEEAFEDHWEHVPRDFESWLRRRADSDTTLWFVVEDEDEIAVATRRAWRGRGIGRALLRASLREFYRRGERTVALAVDSENPTGAVGLYERVGMNVVWRAEVYELRL